ncbi:MAG TPA: DUF2127 domain-containing protein [Candidatus Saccharimonas sp.]|nr:DUF2127 domain-containing protein [Candidatus Saccharimonas sp.]
MHRIISERQADRLFRAAVAVKGIDGVLETLGGLALAVVPLDRIVGLVADLATREIAEDPRSFIASFILQLDRSMDPHSQVFAMVYLIGHGCIKVLLASALLRRQYRWYPWAIGFLLVFIFYQAYRIGYNHSAWLAGFTVVDCVIAWLTFGEWRKHRAVGG